MYSNFVCDRRVPTDGYCQPLSAKTDQSTRAIYNGLRRIERCSQLQLGGNAHARRHQAAPDVRHDNARRYPIHRLCPSKRKGRPACSLLFPPPKSKVPFFLYSVLFELSGGHYQIVRPTLTHQERQQGRQAPLQRSQRNGTAIYFVYLFIYFSKHIFFKRRDFFQFSQSLH
jgi:hypothetical protein